MYHTTVDLAQYSEQMVGAYYDATNGKWFFGIRSDSDADNKGKMCFFGYATTDRYVYGNTRCDNGTPHYLAVTLDRSTNLASLYLDGVGDGSATLTLSTQSLTNFLYMGVSMNVYWFKGKLFCVRISNSVRTAGEILTNAKLMGFA
jgi:hypothetical protein